jgi:CheY-like chemotaxis protein/DNA-binding XRE family transcriptional regulator
MQSSNSNASGDQHFGSPSGDEVSMSPPALDIVALDDDADFRQFLTAMLSADGHQLRAAATPEACFSLCEQQLPDVLLLDMNMGRHSGSTVLLEARKRWPKLCIIIITGYPTMESMRSTFKQDAFDYLAKPFSMDELRRVLAHAAVTLNLGQKPQDRLRFELGRQIRLARTQKPWTLKDLSDASGVSISQLSSIERGAHLPSLESLVAIAHALDQQPSVWLGSAGF